MSNKELVDYSLDMVGDRKDYSDKLQYHRVEKSTMDAISRISKYGYEKHGCYDSWKEQDDPLVYVDALLRHTYELLDGNFFDEESGLCHGDAVVWNAQAFTNLLYKKVGYQQKYLEQDNEICAISWLNMLKKSAYPDDEYQMSINDYEYNIDTSVDYDYVRRECSE